MTVSKRRRQQHSLTHSNTQTSSNKHYSLTSSGLPVKENRSHFKGFFVVVVYLQHCPTFLEYLRKSHSVLQPDVSSLQVGLTEGVTPSPKVRRCLAGVSTLLSPLLSDTLTSVIGCHLKTGLLTLKNRAQKNLQK